MEFIKSILGSFVLAVLFFMILLIASKDRLFTHQEIVEIQLRNHLNADYIINPLTGCYYYTDDRGNVVSPWYLSDGATVKCNK